MMVIPIIWSVQDFDGWTITGVLEHATPPTTVAAPAAKTRSVARARTIILPPRCRRWPRPVPGTAS